MTTVPGSTGDPAPRWICPGCDTSPEGEVDAANPVCPTCNARLVQLNKREKDELVGQVIDGRFEVRSLLGQGGMGTVYRAWQKSIGREVAIKVIDRRYTGDEMAVRRFLREARLASQLSQPNTVSIFDVGQSSDGRLFLAMELLRGSTLEDAVASGGKFSAARAAHIGVQLCDALEAASRLQIVHRDLKPANVILLDDPPGRDLIKVLDFGLAKSLIGDEESSATQSGLLVGTPTYMAPEVLMGAPHTVASDLYAVGVILGEISMGASLWPTSSYSLLLAKKFDRSPHLDEVPAALRPIVERLVSADPAARYASPIDLRAALKPVLDTRDAAAVPKVSFRMEGAPVLLESGTEATVALKPEWPATPAADEPPAPAAEPPAKPAAKPWHKRRAMIAGIAGGLVLAILAVVLVVLLRRPGARAVIADDDAAVEDASRNELDDADVEAEDEEDAAVEDAAVEVEDAS